MRCHLLGFNAAIIGGPLRPGNEDVVPYFSIERKWARE
jgi:hypothetical protein